MSHIKGNVFQIFGTNNANWALFPYVLVLHVEAQSSLSIPMAQEFGKFLNTT